MSNVAQLFTQLLTTLLTQHECAVINSCGVVAARHNNLSAFVSQTSVVQSQAPASRGAMFSECDYFGRYKHTTQDEDKKTISPFQGYPGWRCVAAMVGAHAGRRSEE